MSELKSCPFCNEQKDVQLQAVDDGIHYAVVCLTCAARGPRNYHEYAVSGWNERAGDGDREMERG